MPKNNLSQAILYLIPNSLGEEGNEYVAPIIQDTLEEVWDFAVESEKLARRYIKRILPDKPQDALQLYELNKRTDWGDIAEIAKPLKEGRSMGLISDAGLPCIADPGNLLVHWAHEHHIQVVSLGGNSSIILALITSGLQGQQFVFHGYAPIDKKERAEQIKKWDIEVQKTGYSQIFMETPYRNDALFQSILQSASSQTYLSIACNLLTSEQRIQCMTIENWKKQSPNLHKKPCVFVLGKVYP